MQVEVQSYKDDDMALRLLEYNVLATREHGRPVLPCLIYLRKDSRVAESPLIWQAPIGHEVLRFHFIVIKLWEMKAEELIQTGLIGLLPLVPLTEDGGEYEVVDRVAAELAEANEYDLLEYARRFASLIFKNSADLEWLNRRFAMYRDILEDSWVVQEERREGAVRELRLAVLDVIKARFPEIHLYAKKHIEVLEDTEALRRLNLKMSTVDSEEEALQYLIALAEEEKRTDTDHELPVND